jgi:hypothetical protein
VIFQLGQAACYQSFSEGLAKAESLMKNEKKSIASIV